MKKFLLAFYVLLSACAVWAGTVFTKTVFMDDVSVGEYSSVSNMVAESYYTTTGLMFNANSTQAQYKVYGYKLSGRTPASTNVVYGAVRTAPTVANGTLDLEAGGPVAWNCTSIWVRAYATGAVGRTEISTPMSIYLDNHGAEEPAIGVYFQIGMAHDTKLFPTVVIEYSTNVNVEANYTNAVWFRTTEAAPTITAMFEGSTYFRIDKAGPYSPYTLRETLTDNTFLFTNNAVIVRWPWIEGVMSNIIQRTTNNWTKSYYKLTPASSTNLYDPGNEGGWTEGDPATIWPVIPRPVFPWQGVGVDDNVYLYTPDMVLIERYATFTAAYDAATNGCHIFVPVGEWVVDNGREFKNVTVHGSGKGITLLYGIGDGQGMFAKNNANLQSPTNVLAFENLSLDAGGSYGEEFWLTGMSGGTNAYELHFDNCSVGSGHGQNITVSELTKRVNITARNTDFHGNFPEAELDSLKINEKGCTFDGDIDDLVRVNSDFGWITGNDVPALVFENGEMVAHAELKVPNQTTSSGAVNRVVATNIITDLLGPVGPVLFLLGSEATSVPNVAGKTMKTRMTAAQWALENTNTANGTMYFWAPYSMNGQVLAKGMWRCRFLVNNTLGGASVVTVRMLLYNTDTEAATVIGTWTQSIAPGTRQVFNQFLVMPSEMPVSSANQKIALEVQKDNGVHIITEGQTLAKLEMPLVYGANIETTTPLAAGEEVFGASVAGEESLTLPNTVDEAPFDDGVYVRSNGVWVLAPTNAVGGDVTQADLDEATNAVLVEAEAYADGVASHAYDDATNYTHSVISTSTVNTNASYSWGGTQTFNRVEISNTNNYALLGRSTNNPVGGMSNVVVNGYTGTVVDGVAQVTVPLTQVSADITSLQAEQLITELRVSTLEGVSQQTLLAGVDTYADTTGLATNMSTNLVYLTKSVGNVGSVDPVSFGFGGLAVWFGATPLGFNFSTAQNQMNTAFTAYGNGNVGFPLTNTAGWNGSSFGYKTDYNGTFGSLKYTGSWNYYTQMSLVATFRINGVVSANGSIMSSWGGGYNFANSGFWFGATTNIVYNCRAAAQLIGPTMAPNVWHQAAWAYDKRQTTNAIYYGYLDGLLVASNVFNSTGADYYDLDGYWFNGASASVYNSRMTYGPCGIFTKTLSSNEVAQLYGLTAPTNCYLQSKVYTNTAPFTKVTGMFAAQELTNAISPNTNLIARISSDGGTNKTTVALQRYGTMTDGRTLYQFRTNVTAGTQYMYDMAITTNYGIRFVGASWLLEP